MKYYLSADEYNKLTTTEKYQLALDRYNKRKKNAWEIGIDFERYIGSTYENKGYKVQYRGAIDGLEDMGRDVIAEGNGITYIIQCKRWSVHKTIHEKQSDFSAAENGKIVFFQTKDVFSLNKYFSGVRPVKTAKHMKKCAFSGTGTSDDRSKRTFFYLKILVLV